MSLFCDLNREAILLEEIADIDQQINMLRFKIDTLNEDKQKREGELSQVRYSIKKNLREIMVEN